MYSYGHPPSLQLSTLMRMAMWKAMLKAMWNLESPGKTQGDGKKPG